MKSSSSATAVTLARARVRGPLSLGEHRVGVGERFVLTAVLTPDALTLDWHARELEAPLARLRLSLEPRLRADVVVTLPADDALRSRYEDRTATQLGRGRRPACLFVSADRTDALDEFWSAVGATGQALEPRLRRRHLRSACSLIDRCDAWARSRLPAEAMAFAAGFHHDACAWVLDEVRHDESGRIRQALELCPGLAQVGLLLHDAGQEALWRAAADELIRGGKLNRVLDGLIDASRAGPSGFGDDATARVRQAVRCAGPWVSRACLTGRFPPGISWADAPRRCGKNAAWFELICFARTTQDDRLGEAAVCAFASAHGVALGRALSQSSVGWDRFFAWCKRTRRFPNRRSDPARLIEEAERWWSALDAQSALAKAAKAKLATDGASFPPPPFPDAVEGDLSARAVRDARALHAHGEAMRHCVYDQHVERAVAGDDCIYACAYQGVPFTLAVRREDDRWFFVAASGVRNKPLTAAEREALDTWLASSGVAT